MLINTTKHNVIPSNYFKENEIKFQHNESKKPEDTKYSHNHFI